MSSPLKRPTIQSPETVYDTPGSGIPGLVAPQAGEKVVVQAHPEREYVAGGGIQWLINYARTLAWAIDDVTTDFGDDLYERMMREPQIASTVNAFKAAILEDGANFAPAVSTKDKEGYDQAAELVDFCSAAIEDLEIAFDDVLWNMLDACAYGNKMAEQVYHLDATYTGKEQLVLRAIKVKPRSSAAFVVNVYNSVLGIMGLIPGVGMPVQIGMMVPDPKLSPNLLPREKFAVYAFRPADSDPRGSSLLRPAFDAWWQKQQLKPRFLAYLTQFASPSLIAEAAANAQPRAQTDSMGNPVLDANNNPVMIDPISALVAALQAFQNGTFLVVPNGTKVTPLEMNGEGEAFLRAFDRYDREMVKSILSQTLATEEGVHQPHAAASVHQDVLDTIIRQAKKAVARMIRGDILSRLVRYNYGDAWVRWTPIVSMGRVEERDLAATTNSISQLVASGYPIDASQLTGLDALMKLPPRTGTGIIVTTKNGAQGQPPTEQAPAKAPAPAKGAPAPKAGT